MSTVIKVCFKCGGEKPLSDFYPHKQMKDGHLNKCKDCAKRDVKAHNKSYCNIVWGVPGAGKDWVKRNPKKRAAHCAVSNAIRGGLLIRGPCESCGNEKSQAHHDDYRRPLDVRWLCSKCHSDHHAAINNRG